MQKVLIYSGLAVMYTSHTSPTRKQEFIPRALKTKTTAIHATRKKPVREWMKPHEHPVRSSKEK